MARALLAAVAVVAFAALAGSDGRLSSRDVLVAEAATILPTGSRIVESDYRRQCMSGLVSIPSPPCLSLRFRLPGSASARTLALEAQAGDRWSVARDDLYDGISLRFRREDVRAQAYVTRTCPATVASCDSDYLRVDLRPLPRLHVRS